MEILLGKAVILALAYFAVKFYWDKRQLENQLYIAEHTFFTKTPDLPIEEWFEGSELPPAKKGKK